MSSSYFNTLNYSMANEDTALEHGLLEFDSPHLLSVAGSGGRILPLLAKRPKRVTCVDLVEEQLYLTQLRMESARVLDFEQFLSFWGYPPYDQTDPTIRRDLFKKIKLSSGAKAFFETYFRQNDWQTILYDGKWERTFAKLARINHKITGKRGADLFEILDPQEHRDYLKKSFPHLAWNTVLFLLGNAAVFNKLLYGGAFPKKNFKGSHFSFYRTCFDRLLNHQDVARKNFFLQYLFFGKIRYAEGNTIEANPEVFKNIKAGLEGTEIIYRQGNVIEQIEEASEPVSFVSLSDVPSYFTGDLEKNFLQRTACNLKPNAKVVVRNYLHTPENTDLTGFENVSSQYQSLIDQEKVGVYSVDIFQFGAAGGVQA